MQPSKNDRSFLPSPSPVFINYLYKKPIIFVRKIFSKNSLNAIIRQLYNPDQSDSLKAFSAAFGVFIGIIPIWGFQTLVAIFFAVLFKLNRGLVVLFTQVSFPPLIPIIIFLSYKAGGYLTGKNHTEISLSKKISMAVINENLAQYIFGSLVLAISAAVTIGLVTFLSLKFFRLVKQARLTADTKKA